MNKKLSIVVFFVCMLLVGCVKEPIQMADDTNATAADVANVVDANNQFAFELYSELKEEQGNVFYSPYSISTAFVMAYEGARGQTAEEIQSVFHFPEKDVRRPSFARIYNQINKPKSKYKLNTANALWAQKDYAFLDEYMNTIQNYYGGRVTNVDFVMETEKSRKMINDWVEDQTNNKIKDLIPQGVLNSMTRLVLTNAIYFKGKWKIQFDKRDTRDEDFKITSENVVKVPMMRVSGEKARFNYGETEKLQILELPYEGDDISMLILLPKDENLESLESELSSEKLSEWKNSMREKEVVVHLPRFKFETKYFLVDNLRNMGIYDAFSMDADLSGMDGTPMLYITDVIHQAFVEVNEEGTEAAAATAIVVGFKGVAPSTLFRADHPFIFLIQEKETGQILFMGRVVDPR